MIDEAGDGRVKGRTLVPETGASAGGTEIIVKKCEAEGKSRLLKASEPVGCRRRAGISTVPHHVLLTRNRGHLGRSYDLPRRITFEERMCQFDTT